MKASEKESILNFLNKTSAWLEGYVSEDVKKSESIVFEDDKEILEKKDEISMLSEKKIENKDSENPATNHKEVSQTTVSKTQNEKDTLTDDNFQTDEKNQEKDQKNGITIEDIKKKISSCQKCSLCHTRKNTVSGEGVQNPLVLVIGEGPGENEDIQGRPFVGEAGHLLDKMLLAIGLDRNDNAFITNTVKCRPPMNRDPMPDEVESCSAFLQAQLHALKPKAILVAGRVAAQSILKTNQGISLLHGKIMDYQGIPLMATYHPSALLRNARLKIPAWEDLKKFRTLLETIQSGYEKDYRERHKN